MPPNSGAGSSGSSNFLRWRGSSRRCGPCRRCSARRPLTLPFLRLPLHVLLVHLVRCRERARTDAPTQSRIEAELIDLIVDFEVPAVEGGVERVLGSRFFTGTFWCHGWPAKVAAHHHVESFQFVIGIGGGMDADQSFAAGNEVAQAVLQESSRALAFSFSSLVGLGRPLSSFRVSVNLGRRQSPVVLA